MKLEHEYELGERNISGNYSFEGKCQKDPSALGRSQIRGEDLSPLMQLKDLMHIHQPCMHGMIKEVKHYQTLGLQQEKVMTRVNLPPEIIYCSLPQPGFWRP